MLKAFSIEYKPLGTKYHKNVSLNLVIPNFRRNFANANGKSTRLGGVRSLVRVQSPRLRKSKAYFSYRKVSLFFFCPSPSC